MNHLFIIYSVMAICCSLANGSTRPNVLFVVVDDLRPSLKAYDEKLMVTPNIDNLASKSVVFNRAYVQQALCGPSRTSFLTSRRPDTTHLYDFYSYWRQAAGNFTTLPQHFKQNGYITQSVGKVFHPGKASNFTDDYPYSWSKLPYHPPTQAYKMAKVCPGPGGKLYMNIVCPVNVSAQPGGSLPDIQSTEFATEFLKNQSSNPKQPFFLAVGYHKPHIPLKYPQEYLKLYPLSKIGLAPDPTMPIRMPLVAWNPWTDLRERDDIKRLNLSFPFGPVTKEYQLLMRQSYYAATSYMDAQVGLLLSALDKTGHSNNTIIVFVGDHGWALGEHQEWSKYSLFEVAVRVPLMFYVPGLTYPRMPTGKIFPYINPLKAREDSTFRGLHSADTKDVHQRHEKASQRISDAPYSDNKHLQGVDFFNDLYPKFKNQKQEFSIVKSKNIASESWKQSFDQEYFQVMFGRDHIEKVGKKTEALVELVDMFPTLAELAGLEVPPTCPVNSSKVDLCTEGSSLVPLLKNVTSGDTGSQTQKWKTAIFSQYPRPGVEPQENSDKPHLKDIRIMGYSMRTDQYRYTEWVAFDPHQFKMNWTEVYGRELYLHDSDPNEDNNMAYFSSYQSLVKQMSSSLHAGWRQALPSWKK